MKVNEHTWKLNAVEAKIWFMIDKIISELNLSIAFGRKGVNLVLNMMFAFTILTNHSE